jgi:hypothetical protein
MKAFLKSVVAGLLAAVLTVPAAVAQERPAFTPEELDQMLAPIALYPDPLLTQILMAATYPLEVVQAARWSRANPHLKGQDAVRAVEPMDWDPSVKSLVAFPQILLRMDEQLDWTQRLGEAFLEQEPHVMDAIQGLRQRAERAGNLRSNEQMRVVREDQQIVIEPARPQVVYVPYYDPAVVYGPWWWPAYPPVYWAPWPGYYAGPVYTPGFFWGSGIVISSGFFFGHFNWPHRHVIVVHHQPTKVVVNRQVTVIQRAHVTPDHKPARWQHDPVHRRGVPFRHTALRQQFGQPPATRSDDRSRPAARRESHNAQPGTRSATPQTRPQVTAPQMRPQLATPQPRPERTAPQARDQLPERNARTDVRRPQFRVPDPRPAASAPRAAPLARLVAPAPAARADARPHPQAAHARAAPRRESESAQRAAPRSPIRESFMTPRAAASAPTQVPRATGGHASGGARAHGGGNQPAMSAGRGGGRF